MIRSLVNSTSGSGSGIADNRDFNNASNIWVNGQLTIYNSIIWQSVESEKGKCHFPICAET